jgi:hypothetical protein
MNVEATCVTLTREQAQKVLFTIRSRQDYARHIKATALPAQAEIYRKLDDELEVLKMNIVKQMG